MVRRRQATIDGVPTEVLIPDEEWCAAKYSEFASRYFTE